MRAGGVVNAFAGWIFAVTQSGGSCFYQDLWYNGAERHENMAGAEKKNQDLLLQGEAEIVRWYRLNRMGERVCGSEFMR